jgi:hypothetical protein
MKSMLTSLAGLVLSVVLGNATLAENGPADIHLLPNQTFGFGGDQLLRFTYDQSFSCVDQPRDDRNYNGIKAESDPDEFQTPICQVGAESVLAPTGASVAETEPLYVLVPMFSLNNDQNPNDAFTPGLGKTLIALFGAVPEAFKLHPLVDVQCPDHSGRPGTCTMHASRLDLFPLLSALKKVPAEPAQNIFVPTPNHSHIVNDEAVSTKPIWWQVITVLVTSPQDWPNAEGTSGITSVAKLQAAEKMGAAIETTSNFFLFFDSKTLGHVH